MQIVDVKIFYQVPECCYDPTITEMQQRKCSVKWSSV